MKSIVFGVLFLFSSICFSASDSSIKITEIKVNPTSGKTGTTFDFSAALNNSIPPAYYVGIQLDGKIEKMTRYGKSYKFSRAIYKTGTISYSIGIYTQKNMLLSQVDGSSSISNVLKNGTFVVGSVPDNSASTKNRYTKIANDGTILSDSAKLGDGVKDWACTKDNQTNLTWKIKTITEVRSMSNGYSTSASSQHISSTNGKKICGANNWKLPTVEQLITLVYCPDGKYNTFKNDGSFLNKSICSTQKIGKWGVVESNPAINESFFPNSGIEGNASNYTGTAIWTNTRTVYDSATMNIAKKYGFPKELEAINNDKLLVHFLGGTITSTYYYSSMAAGGIGALVRLVHE